MMSNSDLQPDLQPDPLRDLCLLLRDMIDAADRKRIRATTDKRYGRGPYAKKPPTREG